MKLFLIQLSSLATAEYYSFKEIAAAHRNGHPLASWWIDDGSRTHMHDEWRVCGKPKNPLNAVVDCDGSRCCSICTPGYFTAGRFDGAVCRKGKWSAPMPDCETCAMKEIQSRPGLSSFCSVSAKNNRMTCKLQCTEGNKIFGKLSRGIACKCHNFNGCHWMFTGKGMRREDKHKVDLDDLERICPRPEKPAPPGNKVFFWDRNLGQKRINFWENMRFAVSNRKLAQNSKFSSKIDKFAQISIFFQKSINLHKIRNFLLKSINLYKIRNFL